jgi:hypothetical protein
LPASESERAGKTFVPDCCFYDAFVFAALSFFFFFYPPAGITQASSSSSS